MDFYSDNDPNAVAWIRELLSEGHLPEGVVDGRDIESIQGDEVRDFRRVHFFAGIGGWPLAFELAGWPRGRPVWSGSCPCQPFSQAGKRAGEEDARHLWPHMLRLIRECRPPVVFGEQVSGEDGYRWLAGVQSDLEAAGYAFGAADLPACSVGAPHIRQRFFWLAYACQWGRDAGIGPRGGSRRLADAAGSRAGMADPAVSRLEGGIPEEAETGTRSTGRGARGLADANVPKRGRGQQRFQPEGGCGDGAAGGIERPSHRLADAERDGWRIDESLGRSQGRASHWGSSQTILCADGKARRVEPGIPPLAHGLPGRVALLRGAGNAIVPQVAAEFIQAFLEAEKDLNR